MDTKNLKKLRIYIVDDHKLFREGLKLLLSTQDFVHHIYEASNGRILLRIFTSNSSEK